MEKDQIIGKLSSYFKLSGSEAENIYREMFDEEKTNGGKENGKSPVMIYAGYSNIWNNDDYGEQEIPFPVQKDENQLEFEYDSFAEHRIKVNKEIELEEKSKDPVLMPVHKETQPLQAGTEISPPPAPEETKIVNPEDSEITLANKPEHPAATDNSYYIWYKDAESNEAETETLSYEYELMYQAAKESEYQSKMKIYAASFVFFFSFVLLMLILSPVIYKKFFVTEELQSIGQTLMEGQIEQKAVPNNLKDFPVSDEKSAYPSFSQTVEEEIDENSERGKSLQNTEQNENAEIVPQKQIEPEVTKIEPPDLRKTAYGWADDQYNVLYIQLENGKYTIQESSWDSYEKAEKRKAEIESLNIPGLKGTIEEFDLQNKGKWYRVRFGEFSTIGEARKKVEEFLSL